MPMSRFSGGTLMRRLVATTTRPAISTSPALGFSKPATMRNVVVLPQPLGPSSVTTSPCSTLNETLSTAVILPKILTRFLYFEKSLAHELPNTSISNGIRLSFTCIGRLGVSFDRSGQRHPPRLGMIAGHVQRER